jgi:FAD:protein FMN transferase
MTSSRHRQWSPPLPTSLHLAGTVAVLLFALCSASSFGSLPGEESPETLSSLPESQQQGDVEGVVIDPQTGHRHLKGDVMGTRFKIIYRPAPEREDPLGAVIKVETIDRAVVEKIEAIDAMMSTYKPDSELMLFNASESTDWIDVSPELAETAGLAIRVGSASDAAFDVTIAPLVELWNFGPMPDPSHPSPRSSEIEASQQKMGLKHLEVRLAPPALKKAIPALSVDLSGIAKGYAVDMAGLVFESASVDNYMIEIGGEIRARGERAPGEAWRIGVESPVADTRKVDRVLGLHDASIATSGDYRNYFEVSGRRYSHLLDPRTGRPIAHRLASVSVIHESCAEADAWATALAVLGPEKGYDTAVENNLAALFLIRSDKDNRFEEKATPLFSEAVEVVELPREDAEDEKGSEIIRTVIAVFVVFVLVFLGLAWGAIRGKPQPKCACGAAKNVMRTVEEREKRKRQGVQEIDPENLPILPPDA